jgi:hypothetical protein
MPRVPIGEPEAPAPDSAGPAVRLRVVTVSPGTESMPDVSQVVAKRKKDPYLGCVIDGR